MNSLSQKSNRIIIPAIIIAVAALITILLWPKDPYHVNRHIPKANQDSLLVDVVTYMGVKPRTANWENRTEPIFRKYYIHHAQEYSFHKYFIDENQTHFFYMIRPARHIDGNRRGVGGFLKLDENFQITDYEEIFITKVFDEDYLKQIADDLFMALINNDLESYLKNREMIEWPDGRLKYHRQKREWRYDVEDTE